MRIIAGTMKGRRLQAPDWPGLRPTSDKLRETLFNLLAPHIAGARLLDAYAGTGAVGIEALSRGAAHVTFVDRDPRAVALIEANLRHCGVTGRYAIIRAGLSDLAVAPLPFDLIFLDPPYDSAELASALDAAERLAGHATVLIIEHAKRDKPPERPGTLIRTRSLTSGDSALTLYSRRTTPPQADVNG